MREDFAHVAQPYGLLNAVGYFVAVNTGFGAVVDDGADGEAVGARSRSWSRTSGPSVSPHDVIVGAGEHGVGEVQVDRGAGQVSLVVTTLE